jgi:hypothetical protein
MSSMIPQPPPSIRIGGGPAGAPQGGQAGQSDGPDSQKVKDLLSQARDLIDQAEQLEGDDTDRVMISELSHKITAFIGAQQKTMDSLMGGGPAAKVMRKNSPGSSGPTGY